MSRTEWIDFLRSDVLSSLLYDLLQKTPREEIEAYRRERLGSRKRKPKNDETRPCQGCSYQPPKEGKKSKRRGSSKGY